MPFKSKAQMRYMFATDPEMAKRWAAETEDIKKLPEKKGKYFKKRAALKLPFNSAKLNKFLMRKPPMASKPNMANMFAVKHLTGSKFISPLKPPALNPGAANKIWPIT